MNPTNRDHKAGTSRIAARLYRTYVFWPLAGREMTFRIELALHRLHKHLAIPIERDVSRGLRLDAFSSALSTRSGIINTNI